MTRNESLAWAAGFFDGEGSVTLNRVGPPKICFGISQRSPALLYRFRAVVRYGRIRGPMRWARRRSWIAYQFNIAAIDEIAAVAKMLWPWLGSTKRKQFTRALRPWRTGRRHGNRKAA